MSFTNLAILDIETTGGNLKQDRIIEVGVLLVDDGRVTKTWSTMVNPDRRLDPAITMLTGIRSEDLETAPSFSQIAPELWGLLEGRTFVAHFARFDYGFIKQEFARLGMEFSSQQLCSVKLSRKLFPQERGHGLDKIIERFAIACPNRHRAFDDAAVIWSFFQRVEQLFPADHLQLAIKEISKRPALPTYINAEQIVNLPKTSGVYIFYDERGTPIYVGKSINIKERVMSHFYSDVHDSKELKMKENVRFIETITTSGELEALLKESQLVKELKPVYNRKLRHLAKLYVVSLTEQNGYLACEQAAVQSLTAEDISNKTLAVFRSKREAETRLKGLAEEFSLCWKLLGLEKTKHGCFHYQLGYCHGACKKKEEPAIYNSRMKLAFNKLRLQSWPFQGPIAISERNEITEQYSIHIFDQWCYVKSVVDETEQLTISAAPSQLQFDLDNYKILKQHLRTAPHLVTPLAAVAK